MVCVSVRGMLCVMCDVCESGCVNVWCVVCFCV